MFAGVIDGSMADHDTLDIEVKRNSRGLVVRMVGALDLANAPDLLSTLGPSLDEPMTLDLRELTFLDSSGLSALIRLRDQCSTGLRLIEGPRSVHKVFEITGTVPEFAWIAPSREPRH
jgi:anti-anti-sigma factor